MSMKIKCPVNSLKVAKTQIALGATELYLGGSSNELANITFGGRGKTTWSGNNCTVNQEELKEIVSYAHSKGVEVSYTVNMPIMYQEIVDQYLKYVEEGINAGVDSIIIGSIESLLLLNKYKYPVKYTASVFTECYNEKFLKWLEEMNVSEVYLPHHLKLKEIEQLSKSTSMDIGVFAHFGCSNSNGACFLYHEAGENINVGLPCRGSYEGYSSSRKLKASNYLDAGTDCSVCSIKQLYDAGVKSLKIVGRGKDITLLGALTKVYKMAVDALDDNFDPDAIKEQAIKLMPMMKTDNCDLRRCKYLSGTPILNSFV